jgi:C1A family cysteine protease
MLSYMIFKGVPMSKIKKNTSKFSTKKSGYGWVPDLPDQRDFVYKPTFKLFGLIPKKVDLSPLCSPVENQGNLGSCTANALVGALEFLEKKNKAPFTDMSRLFIYYNERVIEHSVNSDSGAMIRDGIKSLKKQGVCSEKIWPYNISKFTVKPGANCYKEALNHQITSYQRITELDQMRKCLADGFPFIFGFTVYESFESPTVAKTGIVNMPQSNERSIGGHAVLAVGYSDKDKRFLVRNSWGTSWGIKGYFTMPYDYLSDRNLSDDLWTIRSVKQI